MTSLSRTLKNGSYLQSSLTMLLFFGSWGIWWSFFQIWLDSELQFSGAEIGTIYSVNSIATLTIMFFYGTLQDRLGTKRTLAVIASIGMTLTAPFFILVYRPLLENMFMVGVVVGAVVLSTGFMAAAGLLEALAERFSRLYRFEYGQARMWGSFGYAVVALLAGVLFNISPDLNFWLSSLLGLVCLLIQLLWKLPPPPVVERGQSAATDEPRPAAGPGQATGAEPGPADAAAEAASAEVSAEAAGANADGADTSSTPGLREMAGLLKLPALWAVIGVVLCTWTFYTVYDQQMFPSFYTGLFATHEAGNQVYGVLNSGQVFLEAIMMGLIPILMRKIGVRNTLMLGILVMSVRILGSAVFSDPTIVSVIKMFHAVEVPLFILAIFRYFTLHFNSALSATLYMVGFQIASQVGNVILSTPLGALRDHLGYQPVFFVISGIVFVAGIAAFFLLKRDDQDVYGDPLTEAVQVIKVKPSREEQTHA